MSDSNTIEADELQSVASAEGLTVTNLQITQLVQHAEAVLRHNQKVNLTRIVLPSEVVRLHIVDSMLAARFLAAAPDGPVADLGSGPGYPGIPLAILTGRQVTLVESVKKKAAVLREITDELDIDVRVVDLRAEELALSERAAYAAVTARALSSLPALVELAAPLLAKRGLLVSMKGSPSSDELQSGRNAAMICGLAHETTERFILPGGDEIRTIVTYRRTKSPQMRLPRRSGLAQRHPLA
ncbi:MAG: 16S rRNA (guanine(527)-N(7))-methyltransferase RsmG [Coriobacteriia bacterium]|nr:16S rRNA (guanine(527)-N(7))-methyltransferase RsmG [Coriobacteriia bacterium]